jgi:hypothetical protein
MCLQTHVFKQMEYKMKKSVLFPLLIITLILAESGSARTLKYVELGFNQSEFRNQECKSKIGPSFGIGLDYYPIKSIGAFIGTELLYQNKKLLVEDKTWPDFLFPELANHVITGDIDISISYLEIPLQIGYSIKLNNHFSSSISAGYSLSIPIKDHTKSKNKKVRELTLEERGKFDFDYVLVDESAVSWSKNYHAGLQLSYKRLALLICYTKALSLTEQIYRKNIQGKIDSFRASFAFIF